MHTNHRRKTKFRAKHHNRAHNHSVLPITLRWWRKQAHRDRRALERHLIVNERFDDLPSRYPRDILWRYW